MGVAFIDVAPTALDWFAAHSARPNDILSCAMTITEAIQKALALAGDNNVYVVYVSRTAA